MWGNGGWGGNNASTQGALTRADLCQDMNFQEVQNGIRNISDSVNLGFANLNSTICNQQYDTAQMINNVTGAVTGGFSALNSTICQQQYDTAQQLNAMNIANMQNANAANIVALQNANALQSQLAQCCCDQRAATADVKYTMATDTCALNNTIQTSTRDLLDNQNANTRAILDYLCQDKISTLTAENQALKLTASQQAQNAYLVEQLGPKVPIASYQVPNPFVPYGYNTYGFGCSCGCNN